MFIDSLTYLAIYLLYFRLEVIKSAFEWYTIYNDNDSDNDDESKMPTLFNHQETKPKGIVSCSQTFSRA